MNIQRPLGLLVLAVISLLSTGCPKGDAGVVDAAAPPTSATASATSATAPDAAAHASTAEASNDASVARHPSDKAVDHLAVVVKSATGAAATTDAGSGKAVATLKTGTKAAVVDQFGGYERILFADPNDATKKLTGWVQKYVFETGFEGHAIPICAATQIVVSDAASPLEPRCSTRCKTAADCHGTAKYCYAALVLALENEADPTENPSSCGADERLGTPTPAASAKPKH